MSTTINFSNKQMTFVILALEAYSKQLQADEEEPGLSMMDSMFVAELAQTFRAESEKAKNKVE